MMGLDFDPPCARWSYSGFNRFRERLAAEMGQTLQQYWQSPGRNSPLEPLLNHSDCDGELSPEECARVAPALREAVASWPDDDLDKQQALLLARGMEHCAEYDHPLQFC